MCELGVRPDAREPGTPRQWQVDSGSPVFRITDSSGGNGVLLYGVHWGSGYTGPNKRLFSPISGVMADLGALAVTGGVGGIIEPADLAALPLETPDSGRDYRPHTVGAAALALLLVGFFGAWYVRQRRLG